MKRDKGLTIKCFSPMKLLVISLILIAAFVAVTVVLTTIALTPGEAAEKAGSKECEEKALNEAKAMIPEAANLKYIKGDLGEAEGAASFNIEDNEGRVLGVISIDRATRQVVFFYDASKKGPSEKINISKESAKQIAESFLESKGVDLGTGNLTLRDAVLENKGRYGSAENGEANFQYLFTVYEMINGVKVSEGSYCSICISPEDGRVISYGIRLKTSHNKEKASSVSVGKEEAIKIAKSEVSKLADVPKTNPYIPDEEIALEYADFGNGVLTPVWYITLHYGEKDVTDMLGVIRSVYMAIDATSGKLLHAE